MTKSTNRTSATCTRTKARAKQVHGPSFFVFMTIYVVSNFGYLYAYTQILDSPFSMGGVLGFLLLTVVLGRVWWYLSRG